MQLVGKELLYVEYFLKFVGRGHLWTIPCFFGVSISGEDLNDGLEFDWKINFSLKFHR